jgi:hypothetical protein
LGFGIAQDEPMFSQRDGRRDHARQRPRAVLCEDGGESGGTPGIAARS